MKKINDQMEELVNRWKDVYNVIATDSEQIEEYITHTELIMINETIETAHWWIGKTRAPSGFSPGFHLAKSSATLLLRRMFNALEHLEAGEHKFITSFFTSLVTLISSIHTLVIFSDKNFTNNSIASITGEVAQTLSLLSTAQNELSNKSEILQKSTVTSEKINKIFDEIKTIKSEAENQAEVIASTLESCEENADAVQSIFESSTGYQDKYIELITDANELNSRLNIISDTISNLHETAKKQNEIIDSILPKAASAGLSMAFSNRGRQTENTKLIWLCSFIFSLLLLFVFAWHLSNIQPQSSTDYWHLILIRIPLAAPLIWLGWFSAVQYGNIIRIQEDYAFKEATSIAFQGYRDHMNHLRDVDTEEAATALNLLAIKTIEILAKEPLRIYCTNHNDVTPTSTIANFFCKGSKSNAD